jgi:hypothetical protein
MPTLGQVFLAGARCGLASMYVPYPCSSLPTSENTNVLFPQASHDADRTHQDPAAKAATTTFHQQNGMHIPTTVPAVALHVYHAGGIRALYRGLSATIW